MISRLTAFAATFAVFATASLAFAFEVSQDQAAAVETPVKVVRTVELPRVEISAKRLPQAQG
ncbi:hypothetical protein [Methylibium rhizosphaerae]|jgi:hypothetical protein|uniref:hypothetical protein n=1 Tax=Methylibium rhizosphaerae TaxID=2570323 RepID=UPI00112B3069|nr:hypothetical protein [Methylibium rhizosphaerae]